MATYKSKPAKINRSAGDIFSRFSDMSRLQEILEQLPEEQRNVITKAVPLKVSEAEPRKANKK